MNDIQEKIEQYENIIDTLNCLLCDTDNKELKQAVMMMMENFEEDYGEDYKDWQDILMEAENEEKEQTEKDYWAVQF